MSNVDYIQQRKNRKKQHLRIRLGILQMIHKPLLNILLVPIIALVVFIWIKKDIIFTLFKVPQILFPIYKYTIIILAVLLPLLFLLVLVEAIGNITARKDEADLQDAFSNEDLRNGCPILMNKKKIKGTAVIMREFYSYIPIETWKERRKEIAHSMEVYFVGEIQYASEKNRKRIVMYTSPGSEPPKRGGLYDEEL